MGEDTRHKLKSIQRNKQSQRGGSKEKKGLEAVLVVGVEGT